MKLTENFSLDEFQCKDGTSVPSELLPNIMELSYNLQVLRNYLKCPIHINSGYRTPEYNKKVGGEEKSKHMFGMAADITCRDFTPTQVADTIEQLISEGKMKQGGLGRYKGFTHYDVRGKRKRWNNS